jgi:HTH-type transcriptional regulator / antitoxin HipB
MKFKTLEQFHNEALQDPEYRAAWDKEEKRAQSLQNLKEWSVTARLTEEQLKDRFPD